MPWFRSCRSLAQVALAIARSARCWRATGHTASIHHHLSDLQPWRRRLKMMYKIERQGSVLKRMTKNWHPVADSMIPSAYVYTGLSKTPRDSNLEHLINIRLFHVCPFHPLPLPSSIIFNLNIRLCVRFTCAQATPSGRDTCQGDPGCNLLGLAARTCPKDTEGTVT